MALAILALADDLTGALEVGAMLAGRGIATRVSAAPDLAAPPAALVIDTETRHLGPAEARRTVRRLTSAALALGPALLYKKTDSTLRGNIGAELAGMCDAAPGLPVVYAPAYPAMGRTVRGGRLYVDGVPLEQTAFARDPSHPARASEVASVLGGVQAAVLDGETALDVRDAARRIATARPMPIAAGPAALAGALADELDLPRSASPPWPRVRSALVVNGSLHPASAAQAAYTAECPGWRLLDLGGIGGEGRERAARVAELVLAELARSPADALAVFGGDTAFAIHRALGAAFFEPFGEVVEGVPVSRSGGLIWITKAGGFGSPPILCEIQKRLQ